MVFIVIDPGMIAVICNKNIRAERVCQARNGRKTREKRQKKRKMTGKNGKAL